MGAIKNNMSKEKHRLLIEYPETLDEKLISYIDKKGSGSRTSTFIDALNEKLERENPVLSKHN